MLWFLVLHIAALLFWGACLLYLPALIAGASRDRSAIQEPPDPFDSIARFVFTRIATPAALLAIIAGSLVFVVDHTVTVWLVAKLTLVVGLVFVHSLLGMLVLRLEAGNGKPLRSWCLVLGLLASALMGAIIWIVLAKPPLEVWP
ncbi:CopD family protein [Halopseudomonas pelagia]|uniref:CopD family protein n=1 Tax=Halopseudomonas pelagia TaxID=553151 RepID=UPI00039984B5|nr:CopD family protein [Halopseudomonas pelagia]|tara:strand:+ start:714 stop:1148 length:435 start_codon:yes stop_codon:yes gene_type:complete